MCMCVSMLQCLLVTIYSKQLQTVNVNNKQIIVVLLKNKEKANAFFWFCQEKRSEVQDKLACEGNVGHHDLTKALSKM